MGVLCAASALAPGGIAMGNAHMPVKNCYFFCTVLWDLWINLHWLFLGSVPSVFREKLAVGRFASDCMVLCWAGVYGECVFQTFLISFAEVTQFLVFVSERIAPYVAIYLVCLWEEESSGASYISILIPPCQVIYILIWMWFLAYRIV